MFIDAQAIVQTLFFLSVLLLELGTWNFSPQLLHFSRQPDGKVSR